MPSKIFRKIILAVSTDKRLLDRLDKNLSELGFKVVLMKGPDDLLEKLIELKPVVLIMDFILANENAAALCHKIKSDPHTHDTPVILLSEMPGMEQFASKFGSFSILRKPLVISELTKAINEALQKNATAA